MSETDSSVPEILNHLFRYEYSKLVATLTRVLGPGNLETVEDVVQEAMVEALRQWSYQGVPGNAAGWLYRVARNKAVNVFRKADNKADSYDDLQRTIESESHLEAIFDQLFIDKEIADNQLRMMFICCHPAISQDSQVALILKTLCGFSVKEIASAFLTKEDSINKRLVRARKAIKDADIAFELPPEDALSTRLSTVLEAIYLLFNEGYNASQGDDLIRYELCEEAIRLAEIIAGNTRVSEDSAVYALIALMSLNVSRFKARLDGHDNVVELEQQDREKWDYHLINKGLACLERALQDSENELSAYHIMAAISAHYCTAKDFASIDWSGILSLYDNLLAIDPSPLVELNRAVILSKTTDAQTAIEVLEGIDQTSVLDTYLPYHTTKAELYFQAGDIETAVNVLQKAQKVVTQKASKDLIDKKMTDYLNDRLSQ